MTSKEFIAAIHEEVYFSSKNLKESSPQVFSSDSKTTKHPRPSDSTAGSSSSPKHARTSSNMKTCSNPNCGRKGHDLAQCLTYGGGNLGNYSSSWRGPWNLHLPPSQQTHDNNTPLPSHPAFGRVMANRAAAQATSGASAQANTVQAQPITQAPVFLSPYPPPYYPVLPTPPAQANNLTYYPPQANTLAYYPNSPTFPAGPNPYYPRADSTNPTAFNPFINHLDAPEPLVLATGTPANEPLVASIPIFDRQTPKTDVCFYDSATNRHVFHDRSAFHTYESITLLPVKGFGQDLSTAAISCGTVHLEGRHGTRLFPIILTNVLHIPGARTHLLSGGEFTERDIKVLVQKPVSFFAFRHTIFLEAIFEN